MEKSGMLEFGIGLTKFAGFIAAQQVSFFGASTNLDAINRISCSVVGFLSAFPIAFNSHTGKFLEKKLSIKENGITRHFVFYMSNLLLSTFLNTVASGTIGYFQGYQRNDILMVCSKVSTLSILIGIVTLGIEHLYFSKLNITHINPKDTDIELEKSKNYKEIA